MRKNREVREELNDWILYRNFPHLRARIVMSFKLEKILFFFSHSSSLLSFLSLIEKMIGVWLQNNSEDLNEKPVFWSLASINCFFSLLFFISLLSSLSLIPLSPSPKEREEKIKLTHRWFDSNQLSLMVSSVYWKCG